MRKRILSLILIISMILLVPLPSVTVQAKTTEMNIYAMYLDSEDKGDSALIESEGKYLLIDIGCSTSVPAIISQLQELGVTKVSILFSHLHTDHIGASSDDILSGLKQLTAAGIIIDTLYLPDPSLVPLSTTYPARYVQLRTYISSLGYGTIKYLGLGDTVTVGDASGKVIGPVDVSAASGSGSSDSDDAEEEEEEEDEDDGSSDTSTRYENNCSLAMIFTCGSTRYFTAGDCYGDEAAALVAAYGSDLKCDIMKLCHHGIGTGNSEDLLAAVQPTYSFAPNTGVATLKTNGKWRTSGAIKRASKYGMVYLVGQEEQTLIYHVKNDDITLYEGSSIANGTMLSGWQQFYGADGLHRQYDLYYFDEAGKPLTGIQQIDSVIYSFGTGGAMEYGDYSTLTGEYLGWTTDENGKRYFKLTGDGLRASLTIGFAKIDGSRYYFDEDGYCLMNTSEDGSSYALMEIDSEYYMINRLGKIICSSWMETDDEEDMYFNSKGKMIRGRRKKIDGVKYYFDENGIMQTDKIIQINNKKFYFDADGQLVCDQEVVLNGVTYYSNSNGVLHIVEMMGVRQIINS